jgi:hypothetical protein
MDKGGVRPPHYASKLVHIAIRSTIAEICSQIYSQKYSQNRLFKVIAPLLVHFMISWSAFEQDPVLPRNRPRGLRRILYFELQIGISYRSVLDSIDECPRSQLLPGKTSTLEANNLFARIA